LLPRFKSIVAAQILSSHGPKMAGKNTRGYVRTIFSNQRRHIVNALFARSSWIAAILLPALFAGLCFHEAAGIAFPFVNLDEQGHISYAMHLAQAANYFPSLTEMQLYDFTRMQWSSEPNFINHPPLAYHLLDLFTDFDPLGPEVRSVSIAFFALGFAAMLLGLHLTGMFSNLGLSAVTMFCVLLKLQRFGETFSNDSVAFFGGSLAFLGTVMLWRSAVSTRAAQAALAAGGLGTALCIAAKLNAAVLAGSFVLVSLLFFALRERSAFARVSKPLLLLIFLTCLAAAYPYLVFMQDFGSPAPNTPGQVKMLSAGLDAARLGFGAYLFQSLKGALENAGPDAIVTYGIFAVVTGAAALAASLRQNPQTGGFPVQPVARAAVIATGLTLALHLGFSYQRHLRYGWQPELYPRYYFPLLGPYLLLFFSAAMRLGPLRAFAPASAS
jgi:hypothetical protein